MFRRENRSLLQYVNQASPWVGDGDRSLLDKIHQLAAEENKALQSLAEVLDFNAKQKEAEPIWRFVEQRN